MPSSHKGPCRCKSPAYNMSVQPMGEQMVSSTKFTWKIINFTELTENCYYSKVFRIGGNNWQILVYPKGNNTDHLSLYLVVADSADLTPGWTRLAEFNLTVINQTTTNSSIKMEASNNFCARETNWGFAMVALSELRDGGFLVNDTLIIEACFHVPEVATEDRPALVTSKEMMDSQFSSLEQFMAGIDESIYCGVRLASDSLSPTLDEVENAKSSLKECLLDLFKLNMTDRLAVAVSTLSRAEVGLSACQRSCIRTFWASFEDFMLDFTRFVRENAGFELQKLMRDKMFFDMEKGLDKAILLEKLSEEIVKEDCKGRWEGIRISKEKIDSDWEVLLVELREAKSKNAKQEKKLKVAKEKKRIAEKMMSRSAKAWSNLMSEFA